MIGLFGGAFDPVHLGHMNHANHILSECQLDTLIFIPTGIPAHKDSLLFTKEQRLHMLELATKHNPQFTISEYEFNGKISYTIDTLKHFKTKYNDIQFIMGSDSFMDLATWDDFLLFASLCNIIVFPRGHTSDTTTQSITEYYNFTHVVEPQRLRGEVGKVYVSNHAHIDISSTQIRQYITTHQDYSQFVPSSIHSALYEYTR